MALSTPAALNPDRPDRFETLSIVVLRSPLTTPLGPIPAGARGVVHEVSGDAGVYLVEFNAPIFCVLDVPAAQLARA